MTAKEFLRRGYRIDQHIESKRSEIERLDALAKSVTVGYGREQVSRSRNVHSSEDAVVNLINAREELHTLVNQYLAVKADIRAVIDLVADADCRMLLEYRYLSLKSWESIMDNMDISRSYMFKLHKKALQMVDTVLATRDSLWEKQ